MNPLVARRSVQRGVVIEQDDVAVEEPLEIRAQGEPLAITMRTPGDDVSLALGFLKSESILGVIDDVGTAAHCGRPGEEGYGNVIDVLPGAGFAFDLARFEGARRGTLTTAACGVCGRRTIDDLLTNIAPRPSSQLAFDVAVHATDKLRARQSAFDKTGGLHAALALDRAGAILASAEDVGRHNAVDKVCGQLLRAKSDAHRVLVVSGRVSFEIVQKAAVSAFDVVVAVSAPSTLAIDLAERAGITLCGFARGGAMNVYAHAERLA